MLITFYFFMKLASYTKSNQCFLCPRHCIIQEGNRGFCNTRMNLDGKLYALNYGKPVGLGIDPIEKKPLFHFLPKTGVLSFGTLGCNFDCLGCQNYDIARGIVDEGNENLIMPKQIIELAKKNNVKIIAYTYTEPTVFFEYMLDVAKLAKENGIKNVVVSNGYIEKEPLNELLEVIDAFNIDLKFFDDKKYTKYSKGRLDCILENLEIINKSNSWLEITNLVIPGWNDDFDVVEDMVKWISENLKKNIPVHFSAFSPMHKLNHVEHTSIETLEKIKKIADKYLDFVYLGNVHEGGETICPKCKKTLIKRDWYCVEVEKGFKGICSCGNKLPGVWK